MADTNPQLFNAEKMYREIHFAMRLLDHTAEHHSLEAGRAQAARALGAVVAVHDLFKQLADGLATLSPELRDQVVAAALKERNKTMQ